MIIFFLVKFFFFLGGGVTLALLLMEGGVDRPTASSVGSLSAIMVACIDVYQTTDAYQRRKNGGSKS